MREAQEYSIDWEEESLSANLARHMRRSDEAISGRIDIVCESYLYDENIELGRVPTQEST